MPTTTPVFTIELAGSRRTNISMDAPSQELTFTATGSDDEPTIRALVEAALTPTIVLSSALFPNSVITLVIQSYEVEQVGNGIWNGSAKYGRRQPRQTGDIVMTFDGTGGTQHIQTSLATENQYADVAYVGAIPNFKQSIGVNNESVEGVDITVPIFKLTFEYYPATALMTPDYIQNLMFLAGTTNDAAWKGFDKGEVLFLGCSGQPRSLDDWQLLMHFLVSDNATDLTVGGITVAQKSGWEYLWINFGNAVSGTKAIKKPLFAYCERVYDNADFTTLGIGV
jgi:hypothetical protein